MNERACYENGAEVYASAGEDDPAWRRRQREEFASMLTGSTVADLGCGAGYDLAAFDAMDLRTVGVDGSTLCLKGSWPVVMAPHSPATRSPRSSRSSPTTWRSPARATAAATSNSCRFPATPSIGAEFFQFLKPPMRVYHPRRGILFFARRSA